VPRSCCAGEGISRQFDAKRVAADLERYRRHGPDRTTRLLIDGLRKALSQANVRDGTLLDVGAGVGVIHHEMLKRDVREAIHVELASEQLVVARQEVERRGHRSLVRFIEGDFVDLADSVDPADIVTLDRVICCYPEMEPLVERSASKAKWLYGAVYPRQAWWVRLMIGIENAVHRLRRSTFQTYIHPSSAIDGVLRGAGLRLVSLVRTLAWEVVVYHRG